MDDKAIAVQAEQIKNLNEKFDDIKKELSKGFENMQNKFEEYNTNYMRRDDVIREIDELKKKLECKLEKSEFEPTQDNLKWLGRLLITQLIAMVFTGIIFLVVHFAGKP